MNNIGRITGNRANTAAGNLSKASRKSAVKENTINTDDSFKSVSSSSPDLIKGTGMVRNLKKGNKKEFKKTDSARLFRPSADGSYLETVKVSCGSPDKVKFVKTEKGGERCLFPSSDERSVFMIKEDGRPEVQVKLPGEEKVGQIEYSMKDNKIFVLTSDALHTIDPQAGEIKDSLIFNKRSPHKAIAASDKGGVILVDEGEMKILDSDLNTKSSDTIGFNPNRISDLPGGNRLFMYDGMNTKILVKDPDGKTLMDEKYINTNSTQITDEGNIFSIGDRVDERGNNWGAEIIRFDSGSGEIFRFKTIRDMNSLIPFKDGSCIACDHSNKKTRFFGIDNKGGTQWNVTLDRRELLNQTFVTKDEKQMLLVVSSYPDRDAIDQEPDTILYRVSLDDKKDMKGKMYESFFERGEDVKPQELFRIKGGRDSMLPMVLDDNRIVVFEKNDVHLLSPEGKKLKSFKSLDLLKKELSSQDVISERIQISSTGTEDLKADKNRVMKLAVNMFVKDNPGLYSTEIVEAGDAGFEYSKSDSMISFTGTLNGAEFMEEAGLKNNEELDGLLAKNNRFNFALKDEITLPFEKGEIRDLKISRKRINYRYGPINGNFDMDFYNRESLFTTALPVKSEKHAYLFAGTNNGKLIWYDLEKKEKKQEFDLGTAVRNIEVRDGGNVLATTADGAVFSLKPALEEGEKLEGELKLSNMNTTIATGEEGEAEGKVVVDKDTRVVNIGGVQLPITGRKDFYIKGS